MKEKSRKAVNKAVSVQVMRDSDAWTIANKIPSKELMYRAGEGIFHAVEWNGPVAVVCGSGNNAGDGYVVADLLQSSGVSCTIFLLSEKFSEDGRYYFERCKEHGIPVKLFPEEQWESVFQDYKMILDCILGTGFQRFRSLCCLCRYQQWSERRQRLWNKVCKVRPHCFHW